MYYNNNYIANRYQPVVQNQMGMQPMFQQQMMQQQFPQTPQQQMLGLKGKLVSSLDEVRATTVDMDGSETYFPHPASNSIFTKSIDMNGNQIIRRYILEDTNNGTEITIADLDKRIKSLEDIMDNLTGGNKE